MNQPGDIVRVYEDPITLKKYEGKAKLEKLLHTDGGLQYWTVKFLDGFRTERWINPKLEYIQYDEEEERKIASEEAI